MCVCGGGGVWWLGLCSHVNLVCCHTKSLGETETPLFFLFSMCPRVTSIDCIYNNPGPSCSTHH